MKRMPNEILKSEPFCEFLADLAALGVTSVENGDQTYAVISARSNARWWLLPLQSRRAAASGLAMFQPTSKAASLAKYIARLLVRFGPLNLVGSGHLRLSGLPDLMQVFGDNAAHIAYFTGTDGPHRKTALQFMDKRGTISGYAKLSRADRVRPYILNEARVLQKLEKLELEAADIPKVLSFSDDDSLTCLVTDSLKTAAHSVQLEPSVEHFALLDELYSKTGSLGAGKTIDALTEQMEGLAEFAGPIWKQRLTQALALLASQVDSIPVCLVHGDFTPWNTFFQNKRLYVFDWEYAQADWPVGYDLSHFVLATMPPNEHIERLFGLQQLLAKRHFNNDMEAAQRSLLFSLVCHALFYIERLAKAGRPLSDWPEGDTRGAMIDKLLAASYASA